MEGWGRLVLPPPGHFLQVTSCLAHSAMHTLVFLSTRLRCSVPVCCLPGPAPAAARELFPLLFKVAFMDKKTVSAA